MRFIVGNQKRVRTTQQTTSTVQYFIYQQTDIGKARAQNGSRKVRRNARRRSSWIVTWYQHLLVQGSQPYIWNV